MAEALKTSSITRTWHNDWVDGSDASKIYYSADMSVRVTGTVYDDDTLYVTVEPLVVSTSKQNQSGAGFINVGGLCWGSDVPTTVNGRWYEYDDQGDETWANVYAQINTQASNVAAKSIIGFYCIDSATDLSGTFGSTAVGSSISKTFQVDTSTGEVSELILGTWARWADTNPSSTTWGNVYVGGNDWITITMDDLFPDYYPWAHKESDTIWRSYNATGHYLQRKEGTSWVDLLNHTGTAEGSRVLYKNGSSWPQMPKIGEGRNR